MKIAYFSAFNIAISETFIRELLLALKKKKLDVTHIIGEQKNTTKIFEDTDVNGFYRETFLFKILRKVDDLIGLLLPKRSSLSKTFYKHFSKKRILSSLKKINANIAFIDYGTTAVRVYHVLNQLKIPFVVHFHGYDASSAFGFENYSEDIANVFDSAKHLIVPSEHMKRLLILKGAKSDKISVIHYGVNFEKVNPHDWEIRFNEGPNITAIGRLVSKKNPLALVHAFKIVLDKIPDAKLNLIGDGPLFLKVKNYLRSNKLENNIILHGSMPQEEAFEILNKSWAFAQHSVIGINGDQEGFPNSIAEAAAHELAVISTLHSGIPEEVEDAKTGFLVREFDYVSMGLKMEELLSDFEKCKLFGQAGKKKIESICNNEYRMNRIIELLKINSIK